MTDDLSLGGPISTIGAIWQIFTAYVSAMYQLRKAILCPSLPAKHRQTYNTRLQTGYNSQLHFNVRIPWYNPKYIN